MEVLFVNPLRIPLNLLDLHLLWEFTPSEENSEQESSIITNKVNCLLLVAKFAGRLCYKVRNVNIVSLFSQLFKLFTSFFVVLKQMICGTKC